MSKIFLILSMIFCHIVDDYYLQGWLAQAKQRKFWRENAPQRMYRNDYIMALAMHSMSWSFMILLPVAVRQGFDVGVWFLVAFTINAIIHAVTDHAKANMLKINLVQDQIVHLMQIIITAELLVP